MKSLYTALALATSFCPAEDTARPTSEVPVGQNEVATSAKKPHEGTPLIVCGNFLNIAILGLPPKYFGGIPTENRNELLRQLSNDPWDARLDYGKGYLHYTSDNAEENSGIGVECRFYIKLLPTPDTPSVFVFMDRNYSGTDTPSATDAAVLRGSCTEWDDITTSVLPPGIERNRYIIPSRDSLDFEVRKREVRTTGTGSQYYYAGALEAVIRWNGRKFEKIPLTEQDGGGQPATRPESK